MRAAFGRASAETVCSCLNQNATAKPAANAHTMATTVKCGQTFNVFIKPHQIFWCSTTGSTLISKINRPQQPCPVLWGRRFGSGLVGEPSVCLQIFTSIRISTRNCIRGLMQEKSVPNNFTYLLVNAPFRTLLEPSGAIELEANSAVATKSKS